jgi:hypothetical protein
VEEPNYWESSRRGDQLAWSPPGSCLPWAAPASPPRPGASRCPPAATVWRGPGSPGIWRFLPAVDRPAGVAAPSGRLESGGGRSGSADLPPSSCEGCNFPRPPACAGASAPPCGSVSFCILGHTVRPPEAGQLGMMWYLSRWKAGGGRAAAAHPACQAVPAAAHLLPWGCSSLSPDCYQIAPPWVGQRGLEARPDLESGCGQLSPLPVAAFQLWALPTSPARLPAAALLLPSECRVSSCILKSGHTPCLKNHRIVLLRVG